jgi:hypothetical protein
MPAKSPAQKRFMTAVANNPKFAKKVGVPQSVGAEFAKADKRRALRTQPTLQKVNRRKTAHGAKTKLF